MTPQIIQNRYYLMRELGKGGFGRVWLAEERVKNQTIAKVAIKEFGRRMDLTEMKMLARLNSEHILEYKATLEQDDRLYLVTEYADGGSAEDLMRKHPSGLPEKKAREIILRIARALAYLHQLGYIHRDVKPENILFVKGKAKLGDVGTVRRHKGIFSVHTGTQTVPYSAPELFKRKVGKASDIYALGITAYYFLTGQLPFHVKTDAAIERWHKQGDYQIPDGLSDDWVQFLKGALDKKPRNRITSKQVLQLLNGKNATKKEPSAAGSKKETKSGKKKTTRRSSESAPITQEDILYALRSVFQSVIPFGLDKEDAIRLIARKLGYQRAGARIREAIETNLRHAVKRCIIASESGFFFPASRSITDYSQDELTRLMRAGMKSFWWQENEAIFYMTRFLGFRRTGPAIKTAFRRTIRLAIRDGHMERDPKEKFWLRWTD